ncbi:replication initiator protein [Dipodfec virus UOA04_Rod_592]|nr:replication initiator protein [Dipodfec virus UOA04_Rod_592]
MCLQPKIIVNPRFVKMSAFGTYPCVHMPNRDFFYQRGAFDDFDYKMFSSRRNGVTSNNLDDFYAYNMSGEVLPLYIEVACGHCSPCIMRKRSDLKNRLILEQVSHGDVPPLLLTLTYNDACLPDDGVSVKDVQDFLKRFRSYADYHYPINQQFRYLCCSEYVPNKTRRAHYHLLIYGFSVNPRDVWKLEQDIAKCWQKGFVNLKMCDHGCFNYVSKYVCKGSNVPPGKNPNFRLFSRRNGGLGVPAFEDESLYYKLLASPHPLIKVKCLGRVFDVFVPKSIRERLCRSPRQFISKKIIDTYKLFVRSCLLIRNKMDDDFSYSIHASKWLSLHGVPSPQSNCIIPKNIYDKFAAIEMHPIDVTVPWYMRHRSIRDADRWEPILDNYVKYYKILDDFYLDFGKMYHFTYLRGTVYERWKLSLVQFAERNPDTDPLMVEKFNAIIVESYNRHPA